MLVIWAIVAVGLVATRVEMGRLTVMTPAESAAIAAVQKIKLPGGASTEAGAALLGHAQAHARGPRRDHPRRRDADVVCVQPVLGAPRLRLLGASRRQPRRQERGPVVERLGGVAMADGDTRTALAKAAQIMAHPPSPNSVPAVPGIIPSIPPDLQ